MLLVFNGRSRGTLFPVQDVTKQLAWLMANVRTKFPQSWLVWYSATRQRGLCGRIRVRWAFSGSVIETITFKDMGVHAQMHRSPSKRSSRTPVSSFHARTGLTHLQVLFSCSWVWFFLCQRVSESKQVLRNRLCLLCNIMRGILTGAMQCIVTNLCG